MIALDTNVLVYAHRADSEFHQPAADCVKACAEGRALWAIPWSCVHEFLAVVTHPRIYDPPSPIEAALSQVEAWCESPSLVLLAEDEGYWPALKSNVRAGRVAGARVHDARIAALCAAHKVSVLYSADRDFGRFPELRVENPLTA